jgi:hypothetical protein
MTIKDPKILQRMAQRDQRIVDIAKSDPNLTIAQIAKKIGCSPTWVSVVFRRNSINRTVGGHWRSLVVSRG